VKRIEPNSAEILFFWAIALTWPFYAVGALYIIAPSIAWLTLIAVLISLYLGPAIRKDFRVHNAVPAVVWSWIIGMSAMLVALLIGHLNWDLDGIELIKSTIGWMKGWALAAIFPLIGAILPIRREPLIRGNSIVALCTLLLLPILVAAPYLGFPQTLFVSPLSILGGSGPEFFSVILYSLDPETLSPRWQFYAPWAPFAGLIGVIGVIFALEESRRRWMLVGVVGGLALILLSKSRMSLVGLVVCVVVPRLMPLIVREGAWKLLAAIAVSMAVLGDTVLSFINNSIDFFKEARLNSSRLRDTLQRIAIDRWGEEAPWFGHGAVERGPHIVEYMPIGSHHTWFGLLYVKGLAGVGALLLPMTHQFFFTMADAVRGPRGRLPFGIMLAFVIQSLGENLEIEVYLFWPCFLLLGIHAREVENERLAKLAAPLSRTEVDGGALAAA
jgi:hypothetical protein